MLHENKVKQRLKNGETVIGSFVKTNDPAVVEVMAMAGFDFILVDNEHTAMNIENLVNIFRTAEIYNLPAMVRVRTNHPVEILQALDAGALGVLSPQINTVADAQLLVQSAKFAPEGRRGFAHSSRAAEYGTLSPLDYPAIANERTLVLCYCETIEAIQNLDEILQIAEIDLIFVGPFDLSQALGVIGDIDHPKVQEAYDNIIRKSRAAGKAVGTIAANPTQARRLIEKGIQYIVLNSDLGLMLTAAKGMLKELR